MSDQVKNVALTEFLEEAVKGRPELQSAANMVGGLILELGQLVRGMEVAARVALSGEVPPPVVEELLRKLSGDADDLGIPGVSYEVHHIKPGAKPSFGEIMAGLDDDTKPEPTKH